LPERFAAQKSLFGGKVIFPLARQHVVPCLLSGISWWLLIASV